MWPMEFGRKRRVGAERRLSLDWTRILASRRLSGSQAVGASGPRPLRPGTLSPPRHQSAGWEEGEVTLAPVLTVLTG